MEVGWGAYRGLRQAGFLVLGLLICLLASGVGSSVQAQTIVVEGNRRVEAETIRSYFRLSPGERLDAAKIDSALKALYGTNLFQDVRISQSGGRVIVVVIENPVINRVAFEGNKRAKDEQLAGEIQSKPRGTLSRATVQADVARIIEIYQRSGRYDVSVEPKIIELPNSRVDLVFEIREGIKTGVRKIVFVGNKSYSDQRLKNAIRTTETNILSFLKTSDVYDPDKVEADRDLLRRFYLKNGYADVRIVSAVGEYIPDRSGFYITFTIEEGERYRFGSVDLQSRIPAIDPAALRGRMQARPGEIYNAESIEKTVEDLTIEIAKRGYPFAAVRPRGDRNYDTKLVNVVFVIEEGPRVYVERINVRGNTRTRDYVIRREFDFGEGDPFNRAMVDRAERRLKNLNYFKSVKITNEPGSAPDRIVLNVEVEEQSTGEFSVAAGFSTADGLVGEISIGERNLLGRGQVARAALSYGTRARGFELSFVEPYMFNQRLAMGLSLFHRETTSAQFTSFTSKTTGATIRFGVPITDNLTFGPQYQIYRQEIELPLNLRNCNNVSPNSSLGLFPTPANQGMIDPVTGLAFTTNCLVDGEASLAVRRELAQGAAIVSAPGYALAFNTLDQNKNPTKGILAELRQDFAGLGGDVNFIRTTVDTRYYQELFADLTGFARVQAGHITAWGSKDLRMLDHFQGGPNLVRGFQPSGFGPRDLTPGTNLDALGGSIYWATTFELQSPLSFLPKELGFRGAVFLDAGQLMDFQGSTFWSVTGESLTVADSSRVRSAAGVSLIWESPFGPLRFDVAYPISKEPYDRTQIFRFGGGKAF